MNRGVTIEPWLREILRCPVTHSELVDGVDEAGVGARERARELEVVGRVGEDEVHAAGRQAVHRLDAIPEKNLVDGEGLTKRLRLRPGRRRGTPGTLNMEPGGDADGRGTRATHGLHR